MGNPIQDLEFKYNQMKQDIQKILQICNTFDQAFKGLGPMVQLCMNGLIQIGLIKKETNDKNEVRYVLAKKE